MPAKASTTDFENAIRAYVAGEGAEAVAARYHVGERRLATDLRERGLFRDKATRYRLATERGAASNRRNTGVADAEIVRRYQAGESENALAKAFGVSRSVIRARLRVAGVAIRDQTAANRLSNARRTPEERCRYAEAAHGAALGRVATLEEKVQRAKTRERLQTHASPEELLLRDWLVARGVNAIPQGAVGPYNVDLRVGSVAVEVFGGGWHAYGAHLKLAPKRVRYLLDAGLNLVIVWTRDPRREAPITPKAADYIAAFVELARSNPPLRGKYRVIWGDGQDVPPSCLNLDNLTLIPSRRAAKRARSAD